MFVANRVAAVFGSLELGLFYQIVREMFGECCGMGMWGCGEFGLLGRCRRQGAEDRRREAGGRGRRREAGEARGIGGFGLEYRASGIII